MGRDRYKRMVARCTVAGEDLGEWMVSQGWAVADRNVTQAAGADPWLARLYDMAERAARDGRKGRWAETPK